MESKCEYCGCHSNQRCSRCKRRYCSPECMKLDKNIHKNCKAPMIPTLDMFSKEELDQEFKIPVWKGVPILPFFLPKTNPSKNIIDIYDPSMIGFVQQTGKYKTPEEAEQGGLPRYWIRMSDQFSIVNYLSNEEKLRFILMIRQRGV